MFSWAQIYVRSWWVIGWWVKKKKEKIRLFSSANNRSAFNYKAIGFPLDKAYLKVILVSKNKFLHEVNWLHANTTGGRIRMG